MLQSGKNLRMNPYLEALSINYLVYVQDLVKHVQTSTTPAGSFHVAMMFGPLILETGIPEYALASTWTYYRC
jgi:hypothetical protein